MFRDFNGIPNWYYQSKKPLISVLVLLLGRLHNGQKWRILQRMQGLNPIQSKILQLMTEKQKLRKSEQCNFNCKECRLSGSSYIQHTAHKRSLTSDTDARRLWEESEKLLGITSSI